MKSVGRPASEIGSRRRGVLLIVDDSTTLLVALERQFRSAGLFPITASSIEGACAVLDSHVVHCVVCDEILGDGSGTEFLIEVGKLRPGVGRLVLSGFLDERLAARAREAGIFALDKGCRFAELLAAVNREIGND